VFLRKQILIKKVHEFQKASGVVINFWRLGNIGEAVKMVLNGEHLRAKEELETLLEKSKNITKRIEEELKK